MADNCGVNIDGCSTTGKEPALGPECYHPSGDCIYCMVDGEEHRPCTIEQEPCKPCAVGEGRHSFLPPGMRIIPRRKSWDIP